MAPPINKPKLRPISPEVMNASQAGGAPSVQMKQSARKAIIDSTAPNYAGEQVARGVPGSVVPANSNAIKAIFAPPAIGGDDPIIERPVGPVVINPNGPIGEPGRLVDGYNGNPMVAMDDYFRTLAPDYRRSPQTQTQPQAQRVAPIERDYSSSRFADDGPDTIQAYKVRGSEVRPILKTVGTSESPPATRLTGSIDEPAGAADGYAVSALPKTPDYMSGGQRTVFFRPEYNSTRVPGEPLTNTDRFVDRVDMKPDKTQLYTGSPKYTDEAPGAMEAAQRALFRANINRPSYTKTPTRLTPEEQYTIGSSLTADGINPGAFEVNPGGINTYQKKDGSITLPAIAPYAGRAFELNGDGTYKPGNPASPGRVERDSDRPGKANGRALFNDKADNFIGNYSEDQQAQLLQQYRNGIVAPFERIGGDFGVGEPNSSVAGSSSSYAYPQAEPSPGALGDSLRANTGARVSFVSEDGSTPRQLFPGSGTQIVSSPGQKTRDEMIASSVGRNVLVRDPSTLKIDVADMAAGAAARLGQFGSQKTRDILNDQDNRLGYKYPNPTFRDIEPDSTVLPKGSYAVNVNAQGNVISPTPQGFTNLGAGEKGDTPSSLMYDINQDPSNGVLMGAGLKSGAVDYSAQEVSDLVNQAVSKQDLLDASYDLKAYNKPQKEALRSEGRDGSSSPIATQNALSALRAAEPYSEVSNYRTVDPGEMGLMGFLKNYDMTKPSGLAPLPSTKILDPNSDMATFGSVATRGVYDQMGREAATKNKESYYRPAGARNEDSTGWGLPVNQNEDLVPYSDGSLGRARRANGANVAAEIDAIERDPIVAETMGWMKENYPDVYANAQGATAFSSTGVDPTTNQLTSGGYGEAELSGKKVSPSLEKYLDRDSTVPADSISPVKTSTYVRAIDLPGRDPEDTAQNRLYLGSTVEMSATQSDTGEAGFADNTGNPRAFNRSQTMIDPTTGEKQSFRMTDITGQTPEQYLDGMERQAQQQQMALQQKTTEFHRDGGIITDEYGRVLPPNHYVKGFDGKSLYETAIDQDYELGLPARETVYDVAKEIHRAVSPMRRGSDNRDPIFDQFSEELLLQGNATKDMNLRVQETQGRINALNTQTAVDNINDSTALSFAGPDGQVRTSLQQMPPGDQLRIQRALKAAGALEMQNQYSGAAGDYRGDALKGNTDVARREDGLRANIASLQGPSLQDPIEASVGLNRDLNQGRITRDQYDQGVTQNVQRYDQMRAADPYVRQQGLASDGRGARPEESLPSRAQIAYGSPGIMPESMTTRPNPMSELRPRRVLDDGVVSEIARTPMEGMMRQTSGQQYPGSRNAVNPAVQVDQGRELNRGVMSRRQSPISRNAADIANTPQADLDAADAFSRNIAMSAERRRELEALGRQGQRG